MAGIAKLARKGDIQGGLIGMQMVWPGRLRWGGVFVLILAFGFGFSTWVFA